MTPRNANVYESEGHTAWWLPTLAQDRIRRARLRTLTKGATLLGATAVILLAPVLANAWLTGGA